VPVVNRLVAGTPAVPDSPIVLVVDDDADAGEAAATNLRRVGVRVRTALSTEYAFDFCKSQPFDAVVLDHHLADGYSDGLLKAAPEMGLAVIVSAAVPDLVADIHKIYGEREFALLVKPVSPVELVEVVQEAVAESRYLRNHRMTQGMSFLRMKDEIKAPHHELGCRRCRTGVQGHDRRMRDRPCTAAHGVGSYVEAEVTATSQRQDL